MVFMNTKDDKNNKRLKELVEGAELSQPAALKLFNKGFGIRGLSESTWKSYFCDPKTTRWRRFGDDYLHHAEKIFGSMQK